MDKNNTLIILGIFLVCMITGFFIYTTLDNKRLEESQYENDNIEQTEVSPSDEDNKDLDSNHENDEEAQKEPSSNHETIEENPSLEMDINDKLIKKVYNQINYESPLFYSEDISLFSKLYNGSFITSDLLSDKEKLLLTLIAYNREHTLYYMDQYGMISADKTELSNIFFEDSSFLDRIENGDITLGSYLIKKEGNTYNLALAGGGYAGPLSRIVTNFISASRENNYLYINIKFAYLKSNENYIYNSYKTINGSEIIESNIDYNNISNLNWDNYDTYKYTFKIAGNNTYFEKIEKIN